MKEPSGTVIRRVFLFAAAVLCLAALVFGVLLYSRTQAMTLMQMRSNAQDIARIAAELVDAEAFVSLREGDEDTEAYRTVLSALELVRDSSDVEYVYTIRYNDYGVPVFCVDSDPVEPGVIGEAYSGAPVATKALDGQLVSDDAPYRDRWGTHISAYAPVFLNGKPVGAAVVDLNYEVVRREVRQVTMLILTLYAMTFLVGIVLLIYVWKRIERYEFRLRKAREQVEETERVSERFFAPLFSQTGREVLASAQPDAPVPEGDGPRDIAGDGGSLRARYEQTNVLSYDEARRLLGSDELIRQTLVQFREEITNGADEIERLRKEGDYETYTIRVHALKGASRLIGAVALSEQAERLEQMGNRVSEA